MRHCVRVREISSGERSRCAVQLAGQIDLTLATNEIGKHLRPTPAGRSLQGPTVIVQLVAADVEHAID